MLFSVITINRNNAEGLEKTIRSVVAQTYTDFEYIIVDGASTDNSVEVIERESHPQPFLEGREFSAEMQVLPLGKDLGRASISWISESDSGIYNAMNKGVRMAHGDYLLFLNSGDAFASSDVLSTVAQQVLPFGVALPRQTGEPEGGIKTIEDSGGTLASIIIGRVNVVNGERIVSQSKMLTEEDLTLFNLYLWGIPHQASFIRRELLLENPYDESLRINADWRFFVQEIVLKNAKVELVPDVIANYDDGGISSTQTEKLLKERAEAFRSMIPERIAANYQAVFPYYYEVKRVAWLLRHPFFYKVYRAWTSLGMRIKQ